MAACGCGTGCDSAGCGGGAAGAADGKGGNVEAAAACAGGKAGFGFRIGAAIGRGGESAAIPVRGGSAAVRSRRFCSVALANSRDVCAWLALSCSILALSCSICCPIVARSRAIDCTDGADSAEEAAGTGAAPSEG